MNLIMTRHAEREPMSSDPPLTVRGLTQADDLRKSLEQKGWLTAPVVILASPKKRCVETAKVLGVGVAIKIEVNLDECGPGESAQVFERRIEQFFHQLESSGSPTIVVVSHSDWLEAAAYRLFQGRPHLSWGLARAHVTRKEKGVWTYLAQC